MMKTCWRSYDFEPNVKIDSLNRLFQTGLENHASPDVLCNIARDINRLTADRAHVATQAFETVLGVAPDCVDAWSGLAQGLRISGQIDRSVAAAETGLKLAPNRPDLLDVLGKLHLESRRFDEAESAFRLGWETSPNSSSIAFCEVLIRQGKIEEAIEICDEMIERQGPTTTNSAMSYVLSALTGNGEKRDELLNFDLMQDSDQRQFFGNAELAVVNRQIVDRVVNHPSLVFEPGSTATEQGSQTTLNQLLSGDLAEFVIAMIQQQVERFLDEMPRGVFRDRRPTKIGLTTWIVVLQKSGFQHPHIHPNGWLSGVYYVQVPDDQSDSDHPGAIEIGRPPEFLVGEAKAKNATIKPYPGQMLLFPSYFYHRTIPQKSTIPRICIAFDVG